jgi:hypothetical protein
MNFETTAINVEPGDVVLVDSMRTATSTITESFRGITATITEVIEDDTVVTWRTEGGRHFAVVDALSSVTLTN